MTSERAGAGHSVDEVARTERIGEVVMTCGLRSRWAWALMLPCAVAVGGCAELPLILAAGQAIAAYSSQAMEHDEVARRDFEIPVARVYAMLETIVEQDGRAGIVIIF